MRVSHRDPYRSCQKPHIERFHLDPRRILQKGVSSNPPDQGQVNRIMSHPNSHPRPSTGGRTPYDLFVEEFGDEVKRSLGKPGIVRIPADQVTPHPFLLGRRFQKSADRAVLGKNGAIGRKRTVSGTVRQALSREPESQPGASLQPQVAPGPGRRWHCTKKRRYPADGKGSVPFSTRRIPCLPEVIG